MSAPLFNGPPSERSAFFTFRSDVFALNPLPAKGPVNRDLVLFLVSSGKFNIFFNPAPNCDWTNLVRRTRIPTTSLVTSLFGDGIPRSLLRPVSIAGNCNRYP
jgi:hypothetical protein